MSIDVKVADELLTTTRGVRKRLDFDRPVERSVIEECVQVAMHAPTGSDWITHFIAVADPGLRKQVGDLYADVARGYLADMLDSMRAEAEDANALALAEADKFESYHGWYTENLHRAPVLMIIGAKMESPTYIEESAKASVSSFYGSCLPAAWSFMLALRSRGLGTVWTTLTLFREREIGKLLGIPDDITQAVMMPVGYYTGTDFKPISRPPAKDWLHWDHF